MLALAGGAWACVCVDAPIADRLDDADAAVIGKVVFEGVEAGENPQRIMAFKVEQRVKGDVRGDIIVESPSGSSCDLVVERNETVGLLLATGSEGRWLGSACSLVEPGLLVTAGGEPRGGAIKVALGLIILVLVLGWSVQRLKKGKRPDLPGAPGPS